jgi:WD40 repeat protein
MAVVARLKATGSKAPPSVVAVGNDRQVIVGFKDGMMKCYQLTGDFIVQPIWDINSAHKGAVTTVYFDKNYILTGGADSVLRVWARTNHQQLNQISAHQKPISRVLPDQRDASLIHSCSQDKSIHTYNLKTDKK